MDGSVSRGGPAREAAAAAVTASRPGVEAGPVLDGSGRVAVRHSKDPDGQVIVYTRAEWDAFIAGAKDGEFDFAD